MFFRKGTRDIGNFGEDIATRFLTRKGYEIMERNYRTKWGEIDIVAQIGGDVHFVEVKSVSRESGLADISREKSSHRPEEMVHDEKLEKLMKLADYYMNLKGDKRDYQIDVIGVILDKLNRRATCRHFEQVL